MTKLIGLLWILIIPANMLAQNSPMALLLIDIQEFYFPGGFAELKDPEKAASQAALLLDYFRKNQWEVIHVRHKSSRQGEFYSAVKPQEGEKVIEKSEVNCFYGTPLLEYLKQKEVDTLVIAGMQTHMCVEAAVRAAHDLGFTVILIEDACATKDLVYQGDTIPARMVHLSTLSTLRVYAKVLTTREFLKSR